ncbi:multidrug effflux MFS transporter [Notoacmeibacter sp. MSK16QG-6]|uniref:multidrug effflux MFS transporter n=1 Tax=Notoacmeibacter sp. MSK16QG-6 TaxID=2957982 RepID=UPI00209E22D0|nr:multidrug effflux MFS transporter [Notoacmeibacter sp. MSK16QG-6]MCP1199458.1 multidrug effflux MFS transporter [Notoacmeibacter sp. MSK16QG-6]
MDQPFGNLDDEPGELPKPPKQSDLSTLPSGIGRPEFVSILALLMALNALAIDIILPAFRPIADSFQLQNATDTQFTILAYLIGFGAAQPIFGPISDRFGRKMPMVVGIVAYILCAAAGALAPTYEWLLAARVVQGIGAAATRIIALSVIRDTHSGRAMASTMSLVLMVFMIVPVIAPMAGEIIVIFADWEWIFAAMALIALVSGLWTWFRMPETLPIDNRRPLTAKGVLDAFRIVLTTHSAFWYAFAAAGAFSVLFAYINVAQPILDEYYGLGSWFPIAFAIVASFMAATAYANSRLVQKLGQKVISHSALCLQIAAALAFVLFAAIASVPLWLFMILSTLIMVSFSLMGANFNSLAMEEVGQVAGSASSILGFSQTVVGGIVGTIVGQLWNGDLLPVAAGFAAVSISTLVIVMIGERGRLFDSSGR